MGRPKLDDDVALTRQIGVRLTAADYERLEGLSGSLTVSAIVRAALLVGLDILERQPGILLGQKLRLLPQGRP